MNRTFTLLLVSKRELENEEEEETFGRAFRRGRETRAEQDQLRTE